MLGQVDDADALARLPDPAPLGVSVQTVDQNVDTARAEPSRGR